MIKKYILFNFLSIFLFAVFNLSCDTNKWYFKEAGTLIWINDQHNDSAIKSAIEATLDNSSLIVSQVPWEPYDTLFFKNISWFYQLARDHGKSFMINLDWLKNDRSGIRGNQDFSNNRVKTLFINDVKKIVSTYNPDYLTLGVEVNYYALTSPNGYNSFIQIYNDLKTLLKKSNPRLKIGLSFQLELLYGIHHDWNQDTTLQVLNAVVENLDYLGVSTYPDVSILSTLNSFNSLNLLDSLSENYNIPIGILETGINSKKYPNDVRSRYIKEVFSKAVKLDMKFVIWGSIMDPKPSDSHDFNYGLLDYKGIPKKEFIIWATETQRMIK